VNKKPTGGLMFSQKKTQMERIDRKAMASLFFLEN